jgi:hypothetical protein
MVATRSKILACKNVKGPKPGPVVEADKCQDQKTFTILQITAMTKQAIPSQ